MDQQYPKEKVDIGEECLRVDNLSMQGRFENVNFSLHKGEILGLAGLDGCGKNEVARAIFGAVSYTSGMIYLHGEPVKTKNVHSAFKNKLAFLPADRKSDGLFLSQTIKWNITIAAIKKIIRGLIDRKLEKNNVDHFSKELGVKMASANDPASSLSGGNQQKVMLARWLMTDPDILILEEPTRGIDVNAKTEVYRLLMRCVEEGKSVIIVSSESPELLGICDRIVVMHDGLVSVILDAEKSSEAELAQFSQSGGKDVAV